METCAHGAQAAIRFELSIGTQLLLSKVARIYMFPKFVLTFEVCRVQCSFKMAGFLQLILRTVVSAYQVFEVLVSVIAILHCILL